MQQQWAIPWSDCDMRWKVDCIQQPAMTNSVARPRKNSKALPKAKTAWKKVMVTVWRSTASLVHYSFLNPSETINSEKYAQKSVRCIKNCSACIWHWSTEGGQFFFTTTPNLTSYNQHLKSWTSWASKFGLTRHIHLTSHQPTISSSSISTTFCRENASTTNRKPKMLSKSLLNPKARIFTLLE